jgi:predicted nucleotidyltransferase
MTGIARLLQAMLDAGADFIVIGGVAGNLHGAARATYDLDVVYARIHDNLDRVIRALAPLNPYLRGAPKGLPFRWTAETLERGLNFTLTTTVGDIDLLGEVTGGGGYEALLPHSIQVEAFGLKFHCVSLPKLIALKRASGRPRDFDAIAELEVLLEERQNPNNGTPE